MLDYRIVTVNSRGTTSETVCRDLDLQGATLAYNSAKKNGGVIFAALFKSTPNPDAGWAGAVNRECVFKYTRPHTAQGVK